MTSDLFPEALRQNTPRRVVMNFYCRGLVFLFLLFFCTVSGLALYVGGKKDYKNYVLKKYGVDVVGIVAGFRVESSKNGPRYFIDYSFIYPTGLGKSVAEKMATEQIDLIKSDQLVVGTKIDIVYDSKDADISSVDVSGVRGSTDNFRYFKEMLLLVVIFPGIPGLVVAGWFFRRFWDEKRILKYGDCAVASIVNQRQYYIKGDVKGNEVAYEFVDAAGRRVSGSRKAFGSGKVGQVQTVVYDPADSNRHVLYPPDYAVCVAEARV